MQLPLKVIYRKCNIYLDSYVASETLGINGLVNTSGDTNTIPSEINLRITLAEGINSPLEVVYTIIPSAPGNINLGENR